MEILFSYYPGRKRRAITFSYDDARKNGDVQLVEMFNRYNVKGTFHLGSERMKTQEDKVSLEEAKELYKGHEISCHGAHHYFMENVPFGTMVNEIMSDRSTLEKTAGYTVRGMSYPFGSYSDRLIGVLKKCGIEYSRTTEGTMKFGIPEDFMKWHPTCHHRFDLEELLEQFVTRKYLDMPLFYIWGHSWEFVRDNNFDKMENFLKKATQYDDIWFATNIEIYDYITAVRSLKISVDNTMIYNPTCTTVTVEVDGEPIDVKPGNNKLI
ncbi:MAG: polysaccharide deacetylase family protein [Clostridia bacterium]|nr:polysaccharide deacetylase family protein [Clostridia bacterium]